ncbi:hypothetical protein ADIAL_0719 [Alkalibacterium sp. AK22]|uniref:hypothetical protein n=1 Tax=Alkalibacterium sp. AK22 TaxID=1229520 RepID=UPI00044CA8EB|nr:hypothetical protein [Alkalibacterium sp. AK22]EXJ23927.1 hypothetical protein ADIAL_0719 [Alkalibacterium sp. AK22]
MKQVGLTLLLMGSIIYGAVLIAATVYAQILIGADGIGWNSIYGVYGTAYREVGLLPSFLAAGLCAAGAAIVYTSWKKE